MNIHSKDLKRMQDGKFRTRIGIQDLTSRTLEVLEEFEIIAETRAYEYTDVLGQKKYEDVLLLADPLMVPDFRVYFHSKGKIKAVDDSLYEAVGKLLFLNPSPGDASIKAMTEFLIRNFVVYDAENKVSALSYEEVEPVFKVSALADVGSMYVPNARQSVLYNSDTKLSPDLRRKITLEGAMLSGKAALTNAIGAVVEYLNETSNLKINNSRISESSKEVGEYITKPRISRGLDSRLEDRIAEINLTKYFSTEESAAKFEKYLGLQNKSYNSVVKGLGVSKRTVQQFKAIEKDIALADSEQ